MVKIGDKSLEEEVASLRASLENEVEDFTTKAKKRAQWIGGSGAVGIVVGIALCKLFS